MVQRGELGIIPTQGSWRHCCRWSHAEDNAGALCNCTKLWPISWRARGRVGMVMPWARELMMKK